MGNVFVCGVEVFLKPKQVILLPSILYIYKVVSNLFAVHIIFRQVFTCTNIHAPIHLSTIRADNLATRFGGKINSQGRFATGRWTQYRYHLHKGKGNKKSRPNL